MKAIASRVADLERRITAGRSGKVFRVAGGRAGDDCRGFLQSQGIEVGPADRIIQRVILRPGESGPVPVDMPLVMR